ncbi:MAG: hypothetical protein WAW17_06875 [Rhodococcus sp. (in: high G+C Gram-positive bacteria)]|uniref:hypothetical protein n=1 Tax=Rhodococcus sp. TaxID=1831 RepID=UPI003BAEC39A
MKTRTQLYLAAAAVTVVAAAAVTSVVIANDRPEHNIAEERVALLAAVPETCQEQADSIISMFQMLDPATEPARRTCQNYRDGAALGTPLRSLAVEWNQQCLESAGWRLERRQEPDPTGNYPLDPVGPDDGTYMPTRVAHCAMTAPTAEECEGLRQGLDPGGVALSINEAAVLARLGCTNTEVRISEHR